MVFAVPSSRTRHGENDSVISAQRSVTIRRRLITDLVLLIVFAGGTIVTATWISGAWSNRVVPSMNPIDCPSGLTVESLPLLGDQRRQPYPGVRE